MNGQILDSEMNRLKVLRKPSKLYLKNSLRPIETIFDETALHIAARLCSRNYADFQSHVSFKGINWQHLERGDLRIDFPTVKKCMAPSKDYLGQYSPVTSPEAEKRKQKLFSVEVFKVSNMRHL